MRGSERGGYPPPHLFPGAKCFGLWRLQAEICCKYFILKQIAVKYFILLRLGARSWLWMVEGRGLRLED